MLHGSAEHQGRFRDNEFPGSRLYEDERVGESHDAEAATECDQVIELDPANPTAYFSRAKARKTTHDLLGTLADLTKAIALKEDFADAYLQRAEVLLQMGQAGEALPDAEKAIELAPEEENAY